MRTRRTSAKVVAVVALATLLAGCGSDDDTGADADETSAADLPPGEPIKLQVVAAVEGLVGQPEIFDGAEAAAQAINEAGGVEDPAGGENRPIEIVRCEVDAGGSANPDAALDCAREGIDEGVVAVVGKYLLGPDGTKAWEAAGIPLIGTVPIETEDFTNAATFPISGGTPTLAGGIAVALQEAGAESIAFVSADLPVARSLPGFMAPFVTDGAEVVSETYLSADPSTDYTPELSRLASANPDAIAILSSTDQSTRVIAGLRQSGYTGLIGVPASTVSQGMLEDLGDAGEGLISASNFVAVSDPEAEDFVAEMESYDSEAARDEFSMNSWASVHFTADLLGTLDTIDAASLMAALDGAEVDLGIAPAFTLGEPANPFSLPRVFRASIQPQVVEDGELTSTGDFFDLNELVG
jgi:ABC-type branched-subunit amino acid transport system substrate-binding protein